MSQCLNCGTQLIGEFCHQCGQKNEPRIQPVRALLSEVSEVFSADGQLYRTLRLLIRKPWFLTNEYIAGRRTQYVAPVRLYLIISVVYFLVLAVTGFDTFFFAHAAKASIAFKYMRWLPRVMFVILPAFALLLKLLYPRRLYYEHLITSLHLHAITFVILAIHTIFINTWQVLPNLLSIILLFLFDVPLQLTVFVYLFLTLRRVYGGSRLATTGKIVLLILGYMAALTACGAAIINGERLLAYLLSWLGRA